MVIGVEATKQRMEGNEEQWREVEKNDEEVKAEEGGYPHGWGQRRGKRGATGEVVTVKRELLAACMTCPICHRLLRDATAISECLHTCEYSKVQTLLPHNANHVGS
ncbi:hypothetical protein GUJ93_ZPchr0012g20456 [Zizania palustris]|uniref:Uncharacterized protein n=1 Tax=Zizania palustris TaxID=103762 RepID=A0A8J5WQM6_ZIZPA|nr:hypothetical protein GUJ93_ZPchr0012g20456 [Zizania palustris]